MGSGEMPCSAYSIREIRVIRGFFVVEPDFVATASSFSVNVQRDTYECFKCGSLGNQLDLWAAVTKTDLHTAAIDLCEKAHVDIPWIRKW
jgi:hypothetical protein